jgi:hypothetical protein
VEEPNPAIAPMTSDTKATMKNNISSNMIQYSSSNQNKVILFLFL